ncbi:AI-2E family transporter [Ensifer soli]|uniref:AI-2E family transporter n=1 Tax=Ciceribacter sp. sgz301302 TaxID=3342379 RepID=UPI0035BAF836
MTREFDPSVVKRHVLFWCALLIGFVLFLLVFSSILLPFIAGMALAYFLDPVADWLERRGLSRLMATCLILVAFLILFVLSLMIVIPLVISQASDFFQKLPDYVAKLQELLTSFDAEVVPDWISSQMDTIKQNSARILGQGAGLLGTLFQQLWNSGLALLDIISIFIVTPVVAFYLLLDWDRMVATVDGWIPRNHLGTVRRIAAEMDTTIAGFVRGQGSLCIILGLYYGIGLSFAGLNFGLVIGLFAGMISFIPYVGSLVGLVLAFGVALVQFWPDYISIGIVLTIFFSGQFLEGNILQPKLVGKSVGLHPVWLMFALLAFGALFGFVGLLVAVPAAAAIGVLVRFGIRRYLESDLYHGSDTRTLINLDGTPSRVIPHDDQA